MDSGIQAKNEPAIAVGTMSNMQQTRYWHALEMSDAPNPEYAPAVAVRLRTGRSLAMPRAAAATSLPAVSVPKKISRPQSVSPSSTDGRDARLAAVCSSSG